MNIQEAKKEICNTLRAYLAKDEDGDYSYPMVRQRPILLIGPPGIGKTAIMEQAATECGVGLVSYTIDYLCCILDRHPYEPPVFYLLLT